LSLWQTIVLAIVQGLTEFLPVSSSGHIVVANALLTVWGGEPVEDLVEVSIVLHLGTLATDVHLHDTYFVVAHFHYVMMGSALLAMIGGLHHWWPKIVGRMYNENYGRIGWALVFIGFNLTFFPQFVLGSQGMPRRYYDYSSIDPKKLDLYQFYHFWSTMGSYVMALGFFFTLFYLLHSMFAGRKAPANPWGGRSLEWQCSSPPPHDNFAVTPSVGDCYDFTVLEWDEQEQGYTWREDAEHP